MGPAHEEGPLILDRKALLVAQQLSRQRIERRGDVAGYEFQSHLPEHTQRRDGRAGAECRSNPVPVRGPASAGADLVWSRCGPSARAVGLTTLAADERAMEARCARDDVTARSRTWRYVAHRAPD